MGTTEIRSSSALTEKSAHPHTPLAQPRPRHRIRVAPAAGAVLGAAVLAARFGRVAVLHFTTGGGGDVDGCNNPWDTGRLPYGLFVLHRHPF